MTARRWPYLLHGKERRVWGDSAYRGQREVIRKCARHAQDFTQEKATCNHPLSDQQRSRNRTKSKVRAKVEHCFLILVGRVLVRQYQHSIE